MILIIDNYDSFTFNLYQYVGSIQKEVTVIRNDKISIDEITPSEYSHIIISPGPGRPEQAGISIKVIKKLYKEIPILGVCLGHQAIACAFGGDVIHAKELFHGKTSIISQSEKGFLFQNLPKEFIAARYHSLTIDKETLPEELKTTAMSEDDEIMAVEHKEYHLYGVQFHPESIATVEGMDIIRQFLSISEVKRA
ncbi:MAG: aminodeoxychorismate/anthranilate synthase component II [Clostridia bacterium]|nr:aminodeoxychorismate/anthranilate synthase component II [Clostridia bacterium]